MTLGYLGNTDWRDMSDYLVHFVGGRDATAPARFETLGHIVKSRELVAGSEGFGFAKSWKAPRHSQSSVCMSEVPLTYLPRLVARHGSFGVGLYKAHVREAGGQRVWYVDDGTELMAALDAMVRQATDLKQWGDQLWKLTRFIDRVTPEGDGHVRYEFEWEREWRVPERLQLATVPFLFLPENWHAYARQRLGSYLMLDPEWEQSSIERAIGT